MGRTNSKLQAARRNRGIRRVQLLRMPVRNCQIQKMKEHADKWSDNMWTTLQKKGLWDSFTVAWYMSQFLFKKQWRYQKPKPPWKNNPNIFLDTSRVGWQESDTKVWSHPSGEEWWKKQLVNFVNLMDLCHLKNAGFAETLPEIQGASCTPGRQRQRRSRIQSSFHAAKSFSVSDGRGKALGHYLKASWCGWRNKWRSFSVHSCQNDRSSQIVTISTRSITWNLDEDSSTTKTKTLE